MIFLLQRRRADWTYLTKIGQEMTDVIQNYSKFIQIYSILF